MNKKNLRFPIITFPQKKIKKNKMGILDKEVFMVLGFGNSHI